MKLTTHLKYCSCKEHVDLHIHSRHVCMVLCSISQTQRQLYPFALMSFFFWTTLHKRRMTSSGMLRRVGLVRTDVSEERNAIIRATFILRTVLLLLVTANVPSSPILVTLIMEELRSSETSILTRAARSNISIRNSSESPPWKPQILQRYINCCQSLNYSALKKQVPGVPETLVITYQITVWPNRCREELNMYINVANFKELTPCLEVTCCAPTNKFLSTLWNPKVHHSDH
jgi:hypothetical protein